MRKLNLVFGLILFACTVFAQDKKADQPYLKFTDLKDMSSELVWPATVNDGTYIYAVNGYIPTMRGFSSKVLRYDPANDTWVRLSTSAGYKVQSTAAYLPGDSTIYVFGGYDWNTKAVSISMVTVNTHTGKTVEENIVGGIAAINTNSATWNGKVYLWGGTVGDHSIASLVSFDPKTKTFAQLADMPQPGETNGTIINGILYTFGGYDQFLNAKSKNINAYNIATNSWSTIGQLPRSISSNSIAVNGNLIFIIGDYDKGTFLGYFDTASNKFTELKSNMKGRRASGVAVINNKLYLFGGKNGYLNSAAGGLKSVQVADLSGISDEKYSALK